MPQARSWLSRTMVLKAVRISASCCSLATDRKRFQITSKVTGSIALFSIGQIHDNIESFIHAGAPTRADDQGGLTLLDDGRAGKLGTGIERVAIVDRGLDKAALFREIGLT